MSVIVIREWLMPSNPERGIQEEAFLLPSEESFSSYVEKLTGVQDAVATGERYATCEDDEAVRGYIVEQRAVFEANACKAGHKFEYAYDLNYDASGNVASVADQYQCARCGAIDIVE